MKAWMHYEWQTRFALTELLFFWAIFLLPIWISTLPLTIQFAPQHISIWPYLQLTIQRTFNETEALYCISRQYEEMNIFIQHVFLKTHHNLVRRSIAQKAVWLHWLKHWILILYRRVKRCNCGKYFPEKPFPLWSFMWHRRSKDNTMVHLSRLEFSLGLAPCFVHLFSRFIYPWPIWLFKGWSRTAVTLCPNKKMFMIQAFQILSSVLGIFYTVPHLPLSLSLQAVV